MALVTSTKLVKLCRAPVSTGIDDDHWRVYHPGIFQTTQAHSAWPSLRGSVQWAMAVVSYTLRERNGEFCVAVGLAITRTTGILAYCMLA